MSNKLIGASVEDLKFLVAPDLILFFDRLFERIFVALVMFHLILSLLIIVMKTTGVIC